MTVFTTPRFGDEIVSVLEFPPEIPRIWLPITPVAEQKLRWLATLAEDKLTLSLMDATLPVASVTDAFPDALDQGFPVIRDELRQMHRTALAWIALAVRLQNEMGIQVRIDHIELKGAHEPG